MDPKQGQNSLITISDSVSFSVYRTGFLKPCAEKLAQLASESYEDMQCYAASTIVMSAAAVEASVFEFAHKNRNDIYSKNRFTHKGVRKQYKILFDKELVDDFPDINELIEIRNTIVHNEPDYESGRELNLATKLTGDKALWAVKTTNKFIKEILKYTY